MRLPVRSPLIGRFAQRIDMRVIVTMSFLVFAAAFYMRTLFSPDVDFFFVLWPQVVQGIGVAMFFMPLTSIIISGLDAKDIANASSLSNCTRVLAGSIGSSLATTMWERQEALHHVRLTESINPFNPAAQHGLNQLTQMGLSPEQAKVWVANEITRQGFLLGFNELFWLASIAFIGLAGLVIGWAYSAPPLALVSRGLGEAAVAAGWLLVVVGSDYVQRGAFALAPLQAGLSYALLVAAILFINEFPDRRGDAAAGKRTLVVRLGPDGAKWAWLGLVLAAYGWLVLMVGRGQLPRGAAAAALTLILSFRAARSLLAHAADPSALAPALRLAIAAAHLHGLVLAATLAFGRWPGALT